MIFFVVKGGIETCDTYSERLVLCRAPSASTVTPVVMTAALLPSLFASEEEERYILDCMAYFVVLMAACCFVTLLFVNVPYGRYATSKYGFPVNVKFAWFIQELPAFLVPLYLVVWTSSKKATLLPNHLLTAMFLWHYVQRLVVTYGFCLQRGKNCLAIFSFCCRALVYPFLIRGGKPTPFASFVLAFFFCAYNGYMQVRYLRHYAEYPAQWVTHPYFITGRCSVSASTLCTCLSKYLPFIIIRILMCLM